MENERPQTVNPISAVGVYDIRACGPGYGKVVLKASPSTEFSFSSEACWPYESYDAAIFKGIVDTLKQRGYPELIPWKFLLSEIDWDRVRSWQEGYYRAACEATDEILRKIKEEGAD